MAHVGQQISNPRTGQTMRFVHISPDRLTIETVNPPSQLAEPEHVHPRQQSSAQVVSGRLRFIVAGRERVVGPGESITIPANVAHRFEQAGTEDAVALQEFRPALRTAEFFEAWFGLAQRGELDARGMPSLLRLATLAPTFADEIRVVRPPWLVQRAVYALLRPIARVRGYRTGATGHAPSA
jgi:quercetin dioxygenase-like cupin family protein